MPMWLFIILGILGFTVFFIGTAWLVNVLVAWIAKRYSEKTQNQHIERLEKLLPGKNCGDCGCETCREYAAAVFYGNANEDKCPHGNASLPEDMKKVTSEFMAFLENGETVEDVKKDEKERRFRR